MASKPLKAACALLGIALGVATLGGILIVDHNTVIGVRAWHRRDSGTPDWELHVKDLSQTRPAAALELLDGDRRLAAVTPVLSSIALLEEGRKNERMVRILGLRPGTALPFDAYSVIEGQDLNVKEGQGILIGEILAREMGLKVGDRIVVRRPMSTPEGCIDGKMTHLKEGRRPPGAPLKLEIAGILARRYLGARNGGRVAVVSYADGVRIMDGAPFAPRFWVRLPETARKDQLRADLERTFSVTLPQAREVGETPEERAFRSGVRLASFLALGLGLFIIFHLLTLSVTEWIRQVGLLGALGMSGRGLAATFFLEAVILASLGSAVGVGLAVGLGRLLLASGLTTLGWGRPLAGFEVPWTLLLLVGVAGMVASLLGAIPPMLRLRRVAVVDALQQGEAALAAVPPSRFLAPALLAVAPPVLLGAGWALSWVDQGVLMVALELSALFALFIALLWGMPGVLARIFGGVLRLLERPFGPEPYLVRKSLERSLRRFAGSVSAMALVAAAVVSLHALTGSMKDDTDRFAANALEGSLFLRLRGLPRADLRKLEQIGGVRAAVPMDAAFRSDFLVRGLPPDPLLRDSLFSGPVGARAWDLFLKGRGMIVSHTCAREHALEIGESVTLRTLTGPRDFELIAIDDAHGFFPDERSFGVIDEGTMRKVFCRNNDKVFSARLTVDAGASDDDVLSRVRAALPAEALASGRTGHEIREAWRSEINRDFALFDVILILTAGLAGVGMLNSLVVSGLERTREIGLLRAIGVDRSCVYRLFLAEAGMVGLAGGVLGSLMGIPFSMVAIRGLAELSGLSLEYRFQGWWLVLAVASLTTIAVLAALAPAVRAGKADVISAIKYE